MIRRKIIAYGGSAIYAAMTVLINLPFICVCAAAIFVGMYIAAWILSFPAGEPLHQFIAHHWIFFSVLFVAFVIGMIVSSRGRFQKYMREVRACRQSLEYGIPSLAEPVLNKEEKKKTKHKIHKRRKRNPWELPQWRPPKKDGDEYG